MTHNICRQNAALPTIYHSNMSRNYLISISRRPGIGNSRNILPKIEYIAQHVDVASGLSPETFTRRMEENMENVVVVRQRFVVYVTASGMEQKIARRTKKPTDYLKQPSRRVGRDVITVGLWLS